MAAVATALAPPAQPLHKDRSLDSACSAGMAYAHAHAQLSRVWPAADAPGGGGADPILQALRSGAPAQLSDGEPTRACAASDFILLSTSAACDDAAQLPPVVPLLMCGEALALAEQEHEPQPRQQPPRAPRRSGGGGSAGCGSDAGCGSKHLAAASRKQLTSRYRGVCWNKKNKRWQAAINSSGKYIYLGSFTSEEEAARHFDRAAIKIRGRKAKTNFDMADYLGADGELLALPPAALAAATASGAGCEPGTDDDDGGGAATVVSSHAPQQQQQQPPDGGCTPAGMPLVTTSMPLSWPSGAAPQPQPLWASVFGEARPLSSSRSGAGSGGGGESGSALLNGWRGAPTLGAAAGAACAGLAGCDLAEALRLAQQAAAERGVTDLASVLRAMSEGRAPPALLQGGAAPQQDGEETGTAGDRRSGPVAPLVDAVGGVAAAPPMDGAVAAAEPWAGPDRCAAATGCGEASEGSGAPPPAKRARVALPGSRDCDGKGTPPPQH